jgi:phosphatidate phosphatase APP1
MRNWKKVAHRTAARLERRFEITRAVPGTLTVEIHPFRGYGTPTTLHVLGRVLRQPRIALAADSGTPWSNLVETFRRLRSEEVTAAEVVAEIGEVSVGARTDDEGYFHIEIAIPPQLAAATAHQVQVRAVAPPSRPTVVDVIVPPATARFGVISDIDDTIVETNATAPLRMARTVFTRNARGRVAAPGVAGFYRALRGGVSGVDSNPFFYVSSSPWNFFDLLDQFLALHDIPPGPLMLQDYGLDETKLVHSAHDDHKLEQIEEIFRTYPELPFVLTGDSGQRDPEIYQTVAKRFPARIRAIYIRDVTSRPERDAQVRAIAQELSSAGVRIALVTNWEEAMRHAQAIGLLR